jgi:Family of unknown function (DUF6216)
MSLTVIARDIGQLLNIPSIVILGLLLVLPIAWTCWRTRSSHVILIRLWRFVYGRQILKDREIGRYFLALEKLMQIRFITGLPFRTLQSAKRMIAWSTENDEDLSAVKKCKELFDLENRSIKVDLLPSKTRQVVRLVCFLVLAWAAAALSLAALQSDAIFQMKKSRVWFSMSTDTAVNFLGNGVITASDCEAKTSNLGARMGITEVEVDAICNTFKKPTLQKELHASVESQRMISFVLICMLLWFAAFPFLEFSKGAHAHELYKRLQQKAKSNQTGVSS